MESNNYKYQIFPISEYDNFDWSLFATEKETVVFNIAKTEFIVRYINNDISGPNILTHEEALEITRNTDWRDYNPFP